MKTQTNLLIEKAVNYCGSQTALASRAGVSQPSVNKWLYCINQITAESALAIEEATDGRVKASQLRPDIFK